LVAASRHHRRRREWSMVSGAADHSRPWSSAMASAEDGGALRRTWVGGVRLRLVSPCVTGPVGASCWRPGWRRARRRPRGRARGRRGR
jgi:hypothetical protein